MYKYFQWLHIFMKGGESIMAKGKYQEWLEPDGLTKLEAWARNGLTDEQIAHNMGINVATLYTWKSKYSKINESLKRGKEVVDILVENALLKRALGYTYKEITQERIADTGQKKRHNGVYELTDKDWNVCLAYFNHKCAYCGSMNEITKDHIDPLKNGGNLSLDNVVPACKKCNSSKKDNQWMAWYQKQKFYDENKAQKIIDYFQFVLNLPRENLNDDGKLVITKEVTKEVPPDTTAQIFWLKNRKPNEWRDKKETQLSGEVMANNPFDELTKEELKKLIKDG